MTRVVLSAAEVRAVKRGHFVRVELGAWITVGTGQHAKSAFVGRSRGNLMAYANVCQHQPVELDLPPEPGDPIRRVRRAPMAEDGLHLMCHSHGALFRPSDGRCVLGPCYGASLVAFVVEETSESITVLTPDAAEATRGLDRGGDPT